MRTPTLLLSLVLVLASCTQEGTKLAPAEPDAVLLKARAMQALTCVRLERAPASWKVEFRLRGPGSKDEIWQTLSEQPLVDHGYKISSVYRRATEQLYLVVQGGFPETIAVYGPLAGAPECRTPITSAGSAA